jgi:hypothetical protein
MIPSIDLMLGTIERALSVAILPAAGNASAKEEASLAILFTRWLRDVVDHVADAERESQEDCGRALRDIAAMLSTGRASTDARGEIAAHLVAPEVTTAAERRETCRRAKALLSRSLRAAREDGDDAAANAIRRRLADLAVRELEREIAFGRGTGIDPDGAKSPPLADVVTRHAERRSEP